MGDSGVPGKAIGLAISIVLYQSSRPLLENTLKSLADALRVARTSHALECRIYLTDHSPTPEPENNIKHYQHIIGDSAALTYEHTGMNRGFGAGHNHGFSRLTGADYFLVANPDIEVSQPAIQAGIRLLETKPDIGLIAPALHVQNDEWRPACFRYPDPITLFARVIGGRWAGKRSYLYECRDWRPGEIKYDPLLVSGCFMLFRASIFSRLKGFDPKYFMYFEDFDLSLRVLEGGHSAYCPDMKIKHHGGGAGRKGWRHTFWFMRSALRFFMLHGWSQPRNRR